MKREAPTVGSLKKGSTTINEKARRDLDISRDEYGFCAYVQYRQADPGQPKRGFCCDTKDEISFWVGVSRPGLYKMITRMEAKNLITAEGGSGFLAVTKQWIDTENDCKQSFQESQKAKRECKQSLRPGVNKVYRECKQSLQEIKNGVNLVTGNIEVLVRVKELEKVRTEKEGENAARAIFEKALNDYVEATPSNLDFSGGGAAPPETVPQFSDKPQRFDTAEQLQAALLNFYRHHPEEKRVGIDEGGKAKRYPPDRRKEILQGFCAYVVENEEQFRFHTYKKFHARLQRWFLDQEQFQRPAKSTHNPPPTTYTRPARMLADQ